MLFSRLIGQETEYAIRFSPERRRPGNDAIYEALASAIGEQVRTEPGMFPERPQIFLQNGGAFHYEYLPYRADGGLIEGATPECRGPAQLLVYQRAQESLLLKSMARAETILGEAGFPGKLGLLKNCKDAEGHVYGAQESFEVEAARGASLWLYRLSLLLLAPLLVVTVAAGWGIVIVLVLGVIVAAACWTLAAVAFPLRLRGWLEGLVARNDRNFENRVGRWLYWLSYVITWPFIVSQSLLLRCLVFSRMRRELTAFLVSRAVLSGAGSVEADGRFVLSEKGASIRRVSRRSISPNDRAIFDVGNLMKPAHSAVHFYVRPFLGLFHRKQRLQLGLADSNVLDEAEFLKMGTTALVVDMVEAGRLKNVPRVRRPVRALHAIVSDPGLSVKVPTTRGEMSALEIQRACLEEAKSFVRESKPTSLEARTVVRLWEDVLSALEKGEQDRLVGRIDWVTKRYLLEACGGPGTDRRLKTIDLRYHEIGDGYAARLVSSGHARKLISEEEVEHATTEPPMGTPAFARGRFIRERRTSLVPVRVAWDAARIGGRLHGKIVRFPGANG